MVWTLRFVNFLKSEEVCEQIVLVVDGPIADEAEALSLPQHRLEAGDCSLCRFEGLEAADLRHVFLHAELVALDALLKMFGDIVDWLRPEKRILHGCLDR